MLRCIARQPDIWPRTNDYIAKTKIVIFKPLRGALSADVTFEYRGEQIENLDEYKCQGINIQSSLMEKSDINRFTASFYERVRMFLRSFDSYSTSLEWSFIRPFMHIILGQWTMGEQKMNTWFTRAASGVV